MAYQQGCFNSRCESCVRSWQLMRENESDGSHNEPYTSRQATKRTAVASAVEIDMSMTQLIITDGALSLSKLGSCVNKVFYKSLEATVLQKLPSPCLLCECTCLASPISRACIPITNTPKMILSRFKFSMEPAKSTQLVLTQIISHPVL